MTFEITFLDVTEASERYNRGATQPNKTNNPNSSNQSKVTAAATPAIQNASVTPTQPITPKPSVPASLTLPQPSTTSSNTSSKTSTTTAATPTLEQALHNKNLPGPVTFNRLPVSLEVAKTQITHSESGNTSPSAVETQITHSESGNTSSSAVETQITHPESGNTSPSAVKKQRRLPEPSKDEITQAQTLLHTPIAQINYLGTADSCIAKICRIFKLVIYTIFGRHGIFLGSAQDDRIHVQRERAHIAEYETCLNELISALPKTVAISQATVSPKNIIEANDSTEANNLVSIGNNISVLYTAFERRMSDVLTITPDQSPRALRYAVLEDVRVAIETYNKKNPQAIIDSMHWVSHINKQLKCFENTTRESRAAQYLEWYAETMTLEFVQNHNLNIFAEFAESYIAMFGSSHLMLSDKRFTKKQLLERAAIVLRNTVAQKYHEEFTAAIKALPQVVSSEEIANIQASTTLLGYFKEGYLDEAEETSFLKAVFPVNIT